MVERESKEKWIFLGLVSYFLQDFPDDLVVKNLPANEGDVGGSLGQEDPLEKEMATHSSIIAWEIPWTCRLVLHMTKYTYDYIHI